MDRQIQRFGFRENVQLHQYEFYYFYCIKHVNRPQFINFTTENMTVKRQVL